MSQTIAATAVPNTATMQEMTYAQALRAALRDEMDRDPSVILVGEDIGIYGGIFRVTEGLTERFGPARVRETAIAENGFVGAAAGMAMTGLRPVVEIMFADFLLVCADALFNQIAKLPTMSGGQSRFPLVIRTQGGGYRGSGPQHSQSLEALFCHMPGFQVVLPATPYDARGLLTAAIQDDRPVAVIEHKLLYSTTGQVPQEPYTLPIGKADVKREGSDVTIVTVSRSVFTALQAADELAKQGVSSEVIDVRSVVPLDMETIKASLAKTEHLVVVHEAYRSCGVGAEILARIVEDEEAFYTLNGPLRRVTGRDRPIPASKPLEDATLPQVSDIVAAVLSLS